RIGPNTFATVTSQRRNSTRNRCFTIHSSFFCLSPEQEGGTLAAALLLSWTKTFRVSGRVQRSEPCQHSTPITLRIAHYRPTSIVYEASAMKISPSAFASRVVMLDARRGQFAGTPRHNQDRPDSDDSSPQE